MYFIVKSIWFIKKVYIVSWEPERRYCHRLCTAIAPFWFSSDDILIRDNHHVYHIIIHIVYTIIILIYVCRRNITYTRFPLFISPDLRDRDKPFRHDELSGIRVRKCTLHFLFYPNKTPTLNVRSNAMSFVINAWNTMLPMHVYVLCIMSLKMYTWRVLSQNGLSAIFDIFKVRAPSYNTK